MSQASSSHAVPQHRITDYATVEATCGGAPVYAFGYSYVDGVSPTFVPNQVFQDGNRNARAKIQPKKPWEIKENKKDWPVIISSRPGRRG